jgi:hypothetical protein
MKQIKTRAIILLLVVLASACSATPAAPTINAVDVQNTAIAAALTLVAQTQAAIPTATSVPPTETSAATATLASSTNTPLSLPTIEATLTSAPVSGSTVDPCSTRILSWSPKGRETTIQIINTVRTAVTVSVYLNETASWGECGYRSYNLGPRDNVVITDLVQGCYDLWAFSTGGQPQVNALGGGCINNPDKWIFEITEGNIKFTGP